MKKCLKIVVLLLAVFVVGIKGVKAETVSITQQFVDNVWSFHYRNGSVWTFGNLPYNYANGKLVYCIQPDARINTSTYNVYSDFTLSGYTEAEKNRMELISYYGYGYPGHNSLKYYMATQELLWLMSPDERIKWTVGNSDNTAQIDVTAEKNEINRLISTHNVLPSFSSSNKEVTASEEITLIDNNNVLNKYNISTTSGLTYTVSGNIVKVKANKMGSFTFSLTPKENYNGTTLIYDDFSIRTQTLASFGKPNLKNASFKINANSIKVKINKKDASTDELIMNDGIKIKIKNKETNEYVRDTYEFKNGVINVKLPVGKYVLEEISTTNPYTINNEGLEFEVLKDDTSKELDFYNEKQTGKISINKTDDDNNKLSGVEFGIYNENSELLDTITTNEGKASIDLPLGSYIVKETKELYGYEKDNNEYKIDLSYKDQNTKVVLENIDIVNKKIKCPITYITTSGKIKIDASFNVYTKDGTLVYSGKTVNGKANIDLEYGDYIIKEIGVPIGYKLNNKEISFSVNDKTCASTLSVNNEKITMPITTSESNIGYLLMLIFNIGGYVFVKKNS